MLVIGRGLEKRAGHLRPIIGGRDAERFLALEVMEERALGDARLGAEIIDGRCGVTLGADERKRSVEQFLPRGPCRLFDCVGAVHVNIPTSWYAVN